MRSRGCATTPVRARTVPRPEWRRQTHFETRGQKLGHGVWDLLYRRA
jgi:tRNA (guanine-N7-)-methyltransferase